ncbi:MAG: 3-deoxy-7-phosphoheptulonate synthase [Candidatus Rifleibacteriota bacterium]
MILVLDPDLDRERQKDLCLKLQKRGFFARLVSQFGHLLISIDGPGEEEISRELSTWNDIKEIIPGKNSYFLASRKCNRRNSLIKVGTGSGQLTFGGDEVVTIAGPCALETEESALSLALKVKEAGCRLFRAMIFKPRSSPYSFQGLGKLGIPILKRLREETGLLLLTEVRDPFEAETVQDFVDMIQVGTRNMSNFQLLRHLGQIKKPILLKRGMGASIEELLCAAEYVLAHGNPDVVLCERGIRTFEHFTRFSLDIGAVPAIKELSHLPVIIDPSHASGKKSLVEPLAMAGIAAGAAGVMLEVHEAPLKAFSDGTQSIQPEELKRIIEQAGKIAQVLNKKLV